MAKTLPGIKTVRLALAIPVGPTSIVADGTISCASSNHFSFESHANWLTGWDCDAVIQQAIVDTLHTLHPEPLVAAFTLETVAVHDVYSSDAAFKMVAEQAVRTLFNISPQLTHLRLSTTNVIHNREDNS